MDRDDAMLEARLSGTSVLAIAKRHQCSTAEVEAVIDQRLAGELDNQMRLKAIKLDIARLEMLMAPFFERAVEQKDVQAGTLCVKILERRALLLGLDQPVTSRFDVYQVSAEQQPSSFERLHEMILRIARKDGGNGGAVSVLSNSDDDEPSSISFSCLSQLPRQYQELASAFAVSFPAHSATISSFPTELPGESILCFLPLPVVR